MILIIELHAMYHSRGAVAEYVVHAK